MGYKEPMFLMKISSMKAYLLLIGWHEVLQDYSAATDTTFNVWVPKQFKEWFQSPWHIEINDYSDLALIIHQMDTENDVYKADSYEELIEFIEEYTRGNTRI